MANVTYSAGIDHVSGALAKPGKSGQHSVPPNMGERFLSFYYQKSCTSDICLFVSPSLSLPKQKFPRSYVRALPDIRQ